MNENAIWIVSENDYRSAKRSAKKSAKKRDSCGDTDFQIGFQTHLMF